MSRVKNCRDTVTLIREVILKVALKPSLVGRRPFGRSLRDNLGEANYESATVARQRVSHGPPGG